MNNKIIVALDNEIRDGIHLVSKLNTPEMSEKIYGFKVGSLWLFERGKKIIHTYHGPYLIKRKSQRPSPVNPVPPVINSRILIPAR